MKKIKTVEVTSEQIKSELPDLLEKLPDWRREKALSFRFPRDRFLCAASFLLLEEIVSRDFQIPSVPRFSYEADGKPYWKEYPHIHFNISHCPTGIACAVSDAPVGIDIEQYFFDRETAQTVLSQRELEDVLNDSSPEQQFAAFWTKKESFLKLKGTGIGNDLQNLLLRHGEEATFETVFYPQFHFAVTTAEWKRNIISPAVTPQRKINDTAANQVRQCHNINHPVR